jgi:hypothetical protein
MTLAAIQTGMIIYINNLKKSYGFKYPEGKS